MTQGAGFAVICCRPNPAGPGHAGTEQDRADRPATPAAGLGDGATAGRHEDDRATRTALSEVLQACAGSPLHWVGRRPGKEIDPLLTGDPHTRVLVVGDDADLAAVVLRLLRKEQLGRIELAYASPRRRTPVTDLWDLPRGTAAVTLARTGEVDLVPLVRDDVGGVLVGAGHLGPVNGTVYVDERRVLRGPAKLIKVEPDREKGLAVTISKRRVLGVGRRPRTTLGRAVQIGTLSTTVVRDGVPYSRRMDRWTFYKHTEPLRLVRGLV